MRDLDMIVAKIKALDPNKISFDNRGNLYIRNYESNSLLLEDKKPLSAISKTFSLAPLLHPEDRLTRKNIHTWLLELLTLTNEWQYDYKQLAMLFNLTSFLHMAIGNLNAAERLCRKQIDYFIQQSKKESTLLKFIIQPWINLGRLDRIKGDYELAYHKFSLLANLSGNNNDVNLFHVDTNYLLASIGLDEEVQQVIKTCSIIEPIKTSLAAKSYLETLNKIELARADKKNHPYASLFDEVEIISYAHLNKMTEAKITCQEALRSAPPHLYHLFLFRQAEIALLENDTAASEILITLVKFITYLEVDKIDANHILFCLKVGQLLQKNNHASLAKNVFQKSFQLAQSFGDELFSIECLEGLQKLTSDNLYKRLLNNYISNSAYQHIVHRYPGAIKPKMMAHINDKCKQLFNRLMAL